MFFIFIVGFCSVILFQTGVRVQTPQGLELQEPLHFNVCAENTDLLSKAVERVKAVIERARGELIAMFVNGAHH